MDRSDESQLIEAFYNFDTDGDGKIPVSEMRSILLDQGLRMSDEEIEEFIKEGDFYNDGFIHYREFAQFLLKIEE